MEPSKVQEKCKRPTPDQPSKPQSIGEWIKLKSKTHPGRPFYINKNTGTSVWHLADAEMLTLQKYDSNEIPEIREPNEPVADDMAPPESKPTKEKLLKRKFTNDKVRKPMLQPSQMLPAANSNPNYIQPQQFVSYEVSQINMPLQPPLPPLVPPYPPPQISVSHYPPPPLPTQVLSYPILPYYQQPHINIPNFPIPCIPTGVIETSNDISNNNEFPVQTTSVFMSRRFKNKAVDSEDDNETTDKDAAQEIVKTNISPAIVKKASQQLEIQKKTPFVRPLHNKYNNKRIHHKPINRNPLSRPRRYLRNDGIKDLREILQAKRSRIMNKVKCQTDDNLISEDETPLNDDNNERDIEIQTTHLNADDNDNNNSVEAVQIGTNNNYQSETRTATGDDGLPMGRQRNIDGLNQPNKFLKYLKSVLGCTNEDLWYVVADTNVFLSNCYFLKKLLNYDESCRILASSPVITELEGQINQRQSEAIQEAATAAINFLESSPNVVTDKMLFAKIKFNVRFATGGDDQILDCILRLSEHHFPLILVSNDKLLVSKSKASHVLSYTVLEMKKYLSSFNAGEEDNLTVKKPLLITFKNPPISSSMTVAKETVPQTAYKSYEITTETKTQVPPLPNTSDSDAHRNLGRKQIQSEIPATDCLVDKDVPTTEVSFADAYSYTKLQLKLTRKAYVETATEPKRESRKEKRSNWWNRRRKQVKTSNTVSITTDSVESTKSKEKQSKAQPLQDSPKNDSNQFNIAEEKSYDSDDSFTISKRFSGSHLISDNSQLQPRTVEESLTNSSDAISNTRSSVSSVNNVIESFNSDNIFDGEIDGHLFDVSDKEMEERLKTGSEEWISRFLQIMEEVLTQVLRQNPLPVNPYEPPWTIHEATECLKKKYDNNSAIFKAATQFSFTIFASSNKMGNIYRSLCPTLFMKLFSHGWSLVIVLHQVLSGRPGSEDLAVAKESLKKLLSDIKGLSDTIDNFVDNSAEECLRTQELNMNTQKSKHMMGSQGDIFQQYDSPQIKSPILQNPNKHQVPTQGSSDFAKVNRSIDKAGLIKSINKYNATNQFEHDEYSQNITIKTPEYSPPADMNKIAEDTTFSQETPDTTLPPNQYQKIKMKFTLHPKYENNMKNKEINTKPAAHKIPKTSSTKEKIKTNLKKNEHFDKKLLRACDYFDKNVNPSSNKNVAMNMNLKSAELDKRVIRKESDKLDKNKHSLTSTATIHDNPVTKRSLKPIPELKKGIISKDTDETDLNMQTTTSKTKGNPVTNSNLIKLTEFVKTKDNDKLDINKQSSTTTSTTNKNPVMNRNLKLSELDKRVIRKESDNLDKNKHSLTSTATTHDNPVTKRSLKPIPELRKRIIWKDTDETDLNMQTTTSKTEGNPATNSNLIKLTEFEKIKDNDKLDINKQSSTTTSTTNKNPVMNRNLKFSELDKRVIRKENNLLVLNKHSSTTTTATITTPFPTTNANPTIRKNIKKNAEYNNRLMNKDIDNIGNHKKSSTTTSTTSGNPAELERRKLRNDNNYAQPHEDMAPIGRSTQAICPKPAQSNVDMDMLSYSEDECDSKDEYEDDKRNNYENMDDGDDNLEAFDEYKDKEKPKVTIKAFLAEIKDTFMHVHSYCKQTYLELNNGKITNSERKLELKEQTEDMHAFLNSLLSTLNSILLRENTSELKQSRFPIFKISDSQCSTYSVVIEKCCAQVKILLDVLSSIISDIIV